MPSPFSSSSSASSSPSSIFSIVMDQSIQKLHLDLPLISTRRASSVDKSDTCTAIYSYATDTSRSVPFLWERVPGVLKDFVKSEEEVFTPKPPPGRWRPPNLNNNHKNNSSSSNDSGGDNNNPDYYTCDENDTNIVFHEATGPKVSRAPSFIMNRFWSAANALAASSVQTLPPKYSTRKAHSRSKDLTKLRIRKIQTGNYVDTHSASPSKSCGIMLLFPFSLNRAICGLKSPIRCQAPKISRVEDFTQRSKKVWDDFGLSDEDDGVSSKAWKSPGWGLPYLDTGRVVRRKEKTVERQITRRQLPKLKSPTEPWLANALNSANRRRN